ncbi:MAG: 16S rRNA (uracil(1498)-N(3))-methyltransferase [Firmicutes bacterium]|nr:16S rRNA (uracil(1498)-N(3))-methyltransferase [Bacillota bacterium]
MSRFFLEQALLGRHAVIEGDDAAHIAKVLRLKPGASIEVVAAGRVYLATLTEVSPNRVTAEVGDVLANSGESDLPIHLYQSLPKGDKLELVIQKATELGVESITPVVTERVVVKLKPDSLAKRLARWQRIALEAAKQSRRGKIPTIGLPISLGELPPVPQSHLALVAWEEDSAPLRVALSGQDVAAVHLLVGPEGGLTPREVDWLRERGWRSISLGPRILRTETAPLALLAIVQYELGDLGGGK